MQVKEMLEKAELEVQEALEQGQDDDRSQGEVEIGSDQRMERVFVDDDDDDDGIEQVNVGRSQMVRTHDESEEED